LFVMGVGNVGEKFIAQINQQKKFLKENLKWTCVWSLCLIPEKWFLTKTELI
jgi:homoserine dehydrogenase